MKEALDEEQIIGKVHSFGYRIFENKNMFLFRESRFVKATKPRECVGDDIVFPRNKVYRRVEFFNVVEPLNDVVRSGIFCGNIEVVSMDVQHSS